MWGERESTNSGQWELGLFLLPENRKRLGTDKEKRKEGCFMFLRSTKRFAALFLALAMAFTLFPAIVSADSTVVISTPEELAALTSLSYGDTGKLADSYRLANDIDMAGVEVTKAIGTIGYEIKPFTGRFDGNGFSILNLTTSANALFAQVEGSVENLTLRGAVVHYSGSDSNVAALAAENKGAIRNCFTVDCTVVSDKASPTGGLAAANIGGTIEKSGVSGGSVTCGSAYGTSQGGLVGNLRGGGRIDQCFATAAVTGQNYWTGGLVGKVENGTVTDSYARGTVTGNTKAGGLAGALASPSALSTVYAAGNVNAASGGALAGSAGGSFDSLGTVDNGYYDQDGTFPVEETVSVAGVTALSGADMQTQTFADELNAGRTVWSWDATINDGFPYLTAAAPPASGPVETEPAVTLLVADYNGETYSYEMLGEPVAVTFPDNQETALTLKDIMDKAAEMGDLSYAEGVGGEAGMVRTINGITPKAPGGWMFTINGQASWVGYGAAQVSDGDRVLWYLGTAENQYKAPSWEDMVDPADPVEYTEIHTPETLAALAQSPESWGGNYRLTADLDMSGAAFTPIGSAEVPFSGRFDGNGKTITGLTVTGGRDSQNIGMFGVLLGAEIKHLTLQDVNITGGSRVGGLAGYAKADFAAETANLIADCHVTGQVTAIGEVFIKQTDVGGLIGCNEGGYDSQTYQSAYSAVQGCSSAAEVTGDTGAEDITIAGHVGGLVGWNTGIISDSMAAGNVRGGNTVGGFVGTNGGQIYRSHAEGQASGGYTAGGFVGSHGLYSTIDACYSTGDVTALGSGGANFGGFAGAVSGKVKNSVSTGTLTPGWSYNGGFAGTFDGTVWAYNENLLTLNQCFGNAVTADGSRIKALGNYIGGVHAPSDAAAEAIGLTQAEAGAKLEAMLKSQAASEELAAEMLKYKDAVVIPATVAEQADVTGLVVKLNENAVANSSVALSYEGGGAYVQSAGSGYVLTQRADAADGKDTATIEMEKDGASVTKDIAVTIAAVRQNVDTEALLSAVADQYKNQSADYWKMTGLLAYGQKPSTAARTEYVSAAVSAMRESGLDTTLAMYMISLCALGYDPSDITLADGTKFDAAEKLRNAESSGNNGDAFRLLAYQQAPDYADEQEARAVIERLLSAQTEDGGWSNDEVNGADPDSTGAVLLGLAAYAAEDAAVKQAAEHAVQYLSGQMLADGNIKSGYEENNYGTNANTSAMAILGLSALGIDVRNDMRFQADDVSLWDGLLSFVSPSGDGFVYEYGEKQADDMATKQAFLAVMAAERGENVFDFRRIKKQPVNLQKKGGGSGGGGFLPGGAGTPGERGKITVTLTLIGDSVHGTGEHQAYETWIPGTALTVDAGAAAAEAVKLALENSGYTCEGLENGYITAVTTPEGVKLEAYTNGPRSGWMYQVNGQEPTVAIGSYILKDGDELALYYVDDWAAQEANAGYNDVSPEDWFYTAVSYVTEKRLFQGDEDGNFLPDEKLDRAMTATVLGRMAAITEAEYLETQTFSDVPLDAWFAGAVNWAAAQKIVNGNGDGTFDPEGCITREQLAAMLYRWAVQNGRAAGAPDTSAVARFADGGTVSAWAAEAMAWAVEAGLIQGTDVNTLEPEGNATRAEAAAILQRYEAMAA